jgi:hypothetical protein
LVTFIWRDDRPWRAQSAASSSPRRERLKRLIVSQPQSRNEQIELVSELAEALRRDLPALDFAVAGLAEDEGRRVLPEWIGDLRRAALDEEVERNWCRRYAASHLVVGVHGSNMVLPSAHAGGVVELIGPERWGNFTQDVLFRDIVDCRETLFRYRFLDELTPPHTLARLISMTLSGRASFRRLMNIL